MAFNADTLFTSNPATNQAGLVSLQQALEAGGAAASTGSLLGLFQGSLPGLLFGLMDLFGSKKDWQADPETTENLIRSLESYQEQLQQQTSTDARGEDTEGAFGIDSDLMFDIQDTLNALYGDLAEEQGIPEGYVRDEQGFLRDVNTGQYWILDSRGKPIITTPPLVPVPMPQTAGGTSGGTSSSSTSPTSTDDSGLVSGQMPAGDSQGGGGAETGSWVYNSDRGVFEQVGGIETFEPVAGNYTDGQVVTSDQASEIFDKWGENVADVDQTPDEGDSLLDIINTSLSRVDLSGTTDRTYGGFAGDTRVTGTTNIDPGSPIGGGGTDTSTGGTDTSGGGTDRTGGFTGDTVITGTTNIDPGDPIPPSGGGTGDDNGGGTNGGSGRRTEPEPEPPSLFRPVTQGSSTAAIFSDFGLNNIPQTPFRIQRMFRRIA